MDLTFTNVALAVVGTAKSFDHCTLVHALWKTFAELKISVWLERVASKLNIADNPSRCPPGESLTCSMSSYVLFVIQGRL